MAKYKVTESVIYSKGELRTYEYNYADYRDANDIFKQIANEVHMHCSSSTKAITISLSDGDKIIKQLTCSFINNI